MSVLNEIIGKDAVWTSIASAVLGRAKRNSKGLLAINCPMCVVRGYTQDTRRRCGIGHEGTLTWVTCFNCGFAAKFIIGERVNGAIRDFMRRVGVPDTEAVHASHWAVNVSNHVLVSDDIKALLPITGTPLFQAKALPASAKTLSDWVHDGCTDPHFKAAADYLFSRGDELAFASDYYWTPETKGHIYLNERLIIPIYLDNKIVGWTGRATNDEVKPKYHKAVPEGILFNADVLSKPHRKYVIIVEGPFDALAIDGVGVLGAALNDKQIAWINASDKTKIIVPDRDKAGGRLIDVALAHDWSVSFPWAPLSGSGNRTWWEADIKDCADACRRYGGLWTLRSVLASATANKLQISLLRRK